MSKLGIHISYKLLFSVGYILQLWTSVSKFKTVWDYNSQDRLDPVLVFSPDGVDLCQLAL